MRVPPLKYLMDNLNGKGDFMAEYKNLSEKDKNDLKQWAEDEQAALNK